MATVSKKQSSRVGKRFAVGYSSESKFLSDTRQLYDLDVQSDLHNIEPARQDIQFVIGDQWEINARLRRERLKKPVLTINRLPAFVAQYIGAWLQSDTTIKVLPAHGGSREIAEIRQGLIRSITRQRTAKQALHKAMETAYICGVGNFAVGLRDATDDIFARDIVFESLDDPFAVIWDRASRDPTGEDAQHCFVMQYMTKDDYHKAWPKAGENDTGWVSDNSELSSMISNGWEIDDMVRVCTFWQMREEPITLGVEVDTGDVIDLSGMTEAEITANVATDQSGQPMIRETMHRYAEAYVLSASRVLEGPIRLDIPRLPVFRVEGWTLQEAGTRYRWGFVRNAKDPQRLHNYWRSIVAEQLMAAPRARWLVDTAALKAGAVDQFRNAHLSADPVLTWDSQAGGGKPELIPPPLLNTAVLTEAGLAVQDLKDVTNKHEASFGQSSNEVSGKAISARQRVSELGDMIYINNMNAALSEAGRVINELIPVVYDVPRTIKVMGADDAESLKEINGIMGDATPDITVGKYSVTYTTGPSYLTKRQEAVDVLLTLMNTMPSAASVFPDILLRNMDIPGADEIEERFATLLPPGLVNPDKLPASRREAVLQKAQAQAQAGQLKEKLQQAAAMLEMEKLRAETAEIKSRTARFIEQARLAGSQVGVDAAKVEVAASKVVVNAAQVGVNMTKVEQSAFAAGLGLATSNHEAGLGLGVGLPPSDGNGEDANDKGFATGLSKALSSLPQAPDVVPPQTSSPGIPPEASGAPPQPLEALQQPQQSPEDLGVSQQPSDGLPEAPAPQIS